MLGAGEEVEDDVRVVEVADLWAVERGEAAHDRQQGGGPRAALRGRQRLVPGQRRPERLGAPPFGDEPLRRPDDVERVRLARLRRVRPGGDAVAAEDAADGCGVRVTDGGDVEPQLEPGPAPGDPGHAIAERLAGQRLAVGGGRERDPGVGMEVVDVGGVDQAVHRGVDRRRRAAAAVEAVVERRDHLVLALDPRVDVDQRAQAVEPQHREPRVGQRAQVAAGSLDPQQLDGRPGDRVDRRALGRGVAARVVRVARVRAEAARPVEQRLAGRGRVDAHAPHPAWLPPTRSATIVAAYPDRA